MTPRSLPTRTLSARPHLDQLKRQAKELLEAFRNRNAEAAKEVHTHYRRADPTTFELHDAQLVLARAYGFDSWSRLKTFVDGATIARLVEAVRAGDLASVRSMVDARPELVHLDVGENDEHRALHHAVLRRQPDIVRFLMQHGADARKGIWPHRDATTAFTLARERGYDEVVRIIEEEERRLSTVKTSPAAGAARPAARPRVLSDAVNSNRLDLVASLLQQGLDPDESGRVEDLEEVVPTWGEPLRACAISGNLAMAELLLSHGANPNTNVYAASSAMYEAHKRQNQQILALLEQHGGRFTPVAVAELGLVDQAARLLAESTGDSPPAPWAGVNVAQDLLWGAIDRPSLEIVRLALDAIDWPRDDPRWHGILHNGLYRRDESDRRPQLEAFRLVLDRCDPSITSWHGTTILHEIAASRGRLTATDRIAYTTLLLDRGARLDSRDHLLESTPLGWACRWGRIELVKLLLDRGADPFETDAAPWATPAAWAQKMGHAEVARLLKGSRPPR